MTLALAAARTRLLRRLRAAGPENAPLLAAVRLALLDTARRPTWLDTDTVQEARDEYTRVLDAHHTALDAAGWLRQRGLLDSARAMLTQARPTLAWRMGANSPDALMFRGVVVDVVGSARAVRAPAQDEWTPLSVIVIPSPTATLRDLWETPIGTFTGAEQVGEVLRMLEEQGQLHTVRQELLLRAAGAIPPDARHPAFQALLAWAMWALQEEGVVQEGGWIAPILHTPLATLVGTYGDAAAATGLRAAMRAVSGVEADLAEIGGNRQITLWTDTEKNAQFVLEADGRMPGDNPHAPWAALTLRSLLGEAMVVGGGIIVERARPMQIDGQHARETFVARLEDGEPRWLDARAAAAAFSHDSTTGLALPHIPGRVYRSGPRADGH